MSYKEIAKVVAYQRDLKSLSKEIEILALEFLDKHDQIATLNDLQEALTQGQKGLIETIAKSSIQKLRQD